MNVMENILIVVTVLGLLLVGALVGAAMTYEVAYKEGQIDAINGIIKYELVEEKTYRLKMEAP